MDPYIGNLVTGVVMLKVMEPLRDGTQREALRFFGALSSEKNASLQQ
jgi:hypothetical protein